MQLPIYFFGDNHFSPTPSLSNDKKIKKLEEFINSLEENKGSIFIMGDFFDYYFEYKKNNPDYFDDIFSMLDKIKKTGFEIYFMAGNHDYWIGDKFRSYTTKSFLVDQTISIGAKKIYVTHGDGILSWDKGYRLLKTILRSRIFNFFYSMLPKSLALSIAKKISYERKDSHEIDQDKLNRIHDELEGFANEKIAEGHNYVIMGHYHHSYNKKLNGGELILLGKCDKKNYNYAVFDGEKLEIRNF